MWVEDTRLRLRKGKKEKKKRKENKNGVEDSSFIVPVIVRNCSSKDEHTDEREIEEVNEEFNFVLQMGSLFYMCTHVMYTYI